MEDVVLIVGISLIFLFGWFLMKRPDQFLVENQKRIEEETVPQQKPCVRLNGDISPDELDEALSRFRSSHTNVKIAIYAPDEFPFPDNESDLTR